MIRKLRARFVLFNMLIVAILLSVMMAMVSIFNSAALKAQSIDALSRVVTMTSVQTDPGEALPEELPVAWFALRVSPQGELQAWGNDYFDLTEEDRLWQLLEQAYAEEEDTGTLREAKLRYCRSGNVVAFADMTAEEMIMRNIHTSTALVFIASLVAFFLVSLLLSYVTARPVEVAWEQQRQFIADASHELKTPLSVIMANAELLQGEGEQRNGFAGNILTMSYRMRSLVERMLELARVDGMKPDCQPLDLSELTLDAVLSVQLLYEERGRGLVHDIQEDLSVLGSSSQLYQLLDVLLDNALKYSQGPDPVELTLRAVGRSCQLTVVSPGEPLTRQQEKDIFKRFYRADPARSCQGGYGLGLAIAQSIVRGHRGTIRAQGREGHNAFIVQLPLRQGSSQKIYE